MTQELLDRTITNYPLRLSIELKKLYTDYKANYKGSLHFRQFMMRHMFSDPLYGLGDSKYYRGLLIYHETGTGKTNVAASAVLSLIDVRQVVALMPKSLHKNFEDAIKKLLESEHITKKSHVDVLRNIKFVTIDAYNAADQMSIYGSLDNKLLVVDEAHNLFKGIINSSSEDSNAYRIYKLIMNATNLRILFLTGTPMTKDPFELVPCFNMLTGTSILPLHYHEFYRYYVGKKSVENKNKFQNRLFGLVSHISLNDKSYPDDDIEKRENHYPDDLGISIVKVEMSETQYVRYRLIRHNEDNAKSKKCSKYEKHVPPVTLPSGSKKSSYFVGSRQMSNFAGPLDVNPENLSTEHFNEESSPKITKIIKMLKEMEGIVLIYSQFSGYGGLKAVAKYLEIDGYKQYKNETTPDKRYAVYSGETDVEIRDKIKKIITTENNMYGDTIKVILVSSVGAEGVDFKNIRHVIILEMYWYWSRITQIIARAIRYKGHEMLPPEKRNVKSYIMTSVANKKIANEMTDKEDMTIDERFYKMAIEKRDIISVFQDALKEICVECVVNGYKDCRLCSPDNNALFSNPDDASIDIEVFDKCVPVDNTDVNVQEIEVDEKKYYYDKSSESLFGYKIYVYDKKLDGYTELPESDHRFKKILDAINKIKK